MHFKRSFSIAAVKHCTTCAATSRSTSSHPLYTQTYLSPTEQLQSSYSSSDRSSTYPAPACTQYRLDHRRSRLGVHSSVQTQSYRGLPFTCRGAYVSTTCSLQNSRSRPDCLFQSSSLGPCSSVRVRSDRLLGRATGAVPRQLKYRTRQSGIQLMHVLGIRVWPSAPLDPWAVCSSCRLVGPIDR